MNDRSDDFVKAVLAGIPDRSVPDLAPQVMRRIAMIPDPVANARRPHGLARLGEWLLESRPLALQWRPVYAFAAVALIALLPLLKGSLEKPGIAPAQQVLVQFRLDAPTAGRVQLAGNFTNWKASVPMKRTGNGVWTVVLPLNPGVHNYAFIVDGNEWIPDPAAPAVSDGFGGLNSQLAVLPPDKGRSL